MKRRKAGTKTKAREMASAIDINSHYRNGKGKITPQMYADVLDEIDQVTEQLNATRQRLWETQDELQESEKVVIELEQQLSEELGSKEKDQETMRLLREENSNQVEEEMRLRDSLELMKKVFTRTQLKAKDDQETISNLKEQNEIQAEEYGALKEELDILKADHKKIYGDREKKLLDMIDKTRRELESATAKQKIAEENIKTMRKRLEAVKSPSETSALIQKQQREIERLEKELRQKTIESMDAPTPEEDESPSSGFLAGLEWVGSGLSQGKPAASKREPEGKRNQGSRRSNKDTRDDESNFLSGINNMFWASE